MKSQTTTITALTAPIILIIIITKGCIHFSSVVDVNMFNTFNTSVPLMGH